MLFSQAFSRGTKIGFRNLEVQEIRGKTYRQVYPRETKIGLRNYNVYCDIQETGGKITEKYVQGKQNWFPEIGRLEKLIKDSTVVTCRPIFFGN